MSSSRIRYNFIHLLLLLLSLSLLLVSASHAQEDTLDEDVILGEKVFNIRCALCHGTEGDGKGLVGVIRRMETSGREQKVYPWDLTKGVFRFRSTRSGCMPKDADLVSIISHGIPISLMPAHEHIPLKEQQAIVAYIKTLSDAWEDAEEYEDEDFCQSIPVHKPDWVGSSDSVAKGKVIYKKMKCWECHGHKGSGDGPKAMDLKDDWGRTMLPFDFTSGELKRGSSPENVYSTFSTGLDGTGMPSYSDSLNENDRWHLVSYTLQLMKKLK